MTETIPVEDSESIMQEIQKRPNWKVFLIEGPRSKFLDTLIIQNEDASKRIVIYAGDENGNQTLRKIASKINPERIQYNC